MLGSRDDFDSVDFPGSFVLRLHGCAAQLPDDLVLVDLVAVTLRLHYAHHYAFTVRFVGKVHDLFRVTRQLNSDRIDLELIACLALA